MSFGILFKHLFKIVWIPASYAKTIDDNEGIEKVWRGLQFEKINKQYKAVRLFQKYRYISLHRELSNLSLNKVTEEDYRGISSCRNKRLSSSDIILRLPEPFIRIRSHPKIPCLSLSCVCCQMNI
jgi:hypothetical protein